MSIKKFKEYNVIDPVNEAHEVSEIQRQFNNMNYIKGYKSHSSAYGNSTEITTRFRLGDRVEVDINEDKHGGKKGKICVGFSKDNKDMLKVEFEEGKSALIEKTFLQKIANEF